MFICSILLQYLFYFIAHETTSLRDTKQREGLDHLVMWVIATGSNRDYKAVASIVFISNIQSANNQQLT